MTGALHVRAPAPRRTHPTRKTPVLSAVHAAARTASRNHADACARELAESLRVAHAAGTTINVNQHVEARAAWPSTTTVIAHFVALFGLPPRRWARELGKHEQGEKGGATS